MNTKNTPATTFSPYQTAVFDHIQNGSGNAVINAVAGAGKTFTITKALELIPSDKQILFLAFNKHIVEELKVKLSKLNKTNVEVMTIHSYGSKSLFRNLRSTLDADKVYKICETLYPTWNVDKEIANGYIGRVKRLVELAKINLVDTPEDLLRVAMQHDIEIMNGEIENSIQVKRIADSNTRVHDFNDMIYFPIRHNLSCKQFDWVFIDECQDLSVCQQELVKRAIKPNGRFVAVGDPHQCIYGFAGADINSFRKLTEIPNTVTLPLSLTYRCSKSVTEHAKTLVPHIQSLETAADGIVRFDGKITEFQSGDMVLSRVNRPLIVLCIRLLSQEIKAYVKGKDIGLNLINMLKKTKKSNFEQAYRVLIDEKRRMVSKMMMKGINEEDALNSVMVKQFEDKLDALDALSQGLKTVESIIVRINKIFSDESQGICLSTVHKSKGLESDRVFIVEPKILQAPWVKQPWEIEQENNIAYVAFTRAKHELVFVPETEFTSYEK